jgi:ABC-type spermidine/putrescine transport system permease subunit II
MPRSSSRRKGVAGLVPALELLPWSLVAGAFFVLPLGVLFVYSFWAVRDFAIVHVWSLANYGHAVGDALNLDLLFRSLAIGAVAGGLCVVLAVPFAYAATFRFPRLRTALLFAALVSMFASYLVRVYAFQTILGESGVINWALRAAGVVTEPVSFLLFNRFAVIVTLANVFLPYVLLPIWASMQGIDRNVLEAARDLGESPGGVFRRVVLPASMPGIVAGFTFAFVLSAGDYVTTTLVGGTDGMMIGRKIANAFGLTNDYPLGSALAFTMLVCLGLVVLLVKLAPAALALLHRPFDRVRLPVMRRRNAPTRLAGLWAHAWVAGVLGFLFLPLVIVVVLSFTTRGVPAFPIHGLTLHWYGNVFGDPVFRDALVTSLLLAALTAVAAALMGTLAAMALVRHRLRARALVTALLVAPLAMPGLVTGIAMLMVYVAAGVTLNTWTILAGHVVFATPFVLLVMAARLREFDMSLEEAARDLGEGPFDVFRRVTLPLIFPAVAGGALIAAALSLDEFVITNFVAGSTVTLPLFIWSKLRIGVTPDTNAVSTLILVGLVILVGLFALLMRLAGTIRSAVAGGTA